MKMRVFRLLVLLLLVLLVVVVGNIPNNLMCCITGCVAQSQQVQGGEGGDEPVVFADEAGNFHVEVGTNKSFFVNDVDIVGMLAQHQEQIEAQETTNTNLQSAITLLNSTISRLPCRAFHPLSYNTSEFNYDVDILQEGVRVDYASNYLSATTFQTGILASNGLVYGVPWAVDAVLIIDPALHNVDATSLSVPTSGGAWYGAIEADNGKLYFLPNDADHVLIIDPSNNNAVDQTSISGLDSGRYTWYGGAKASNNNKIYCVPYNSESVLIIDPSDDTADTTTITNLPSDSSKWVGAVLADNGLIYGIPYNYNFVLIINPTTDTADYTSVAVDRGSDKWLDGVLANNGKIYGIPCDYSKVLVIDPINDNTVSYIDVSLPVSRQNWWGGVVTSKGRVIGVPSGATSALIIDPTTDTADTTSLTFPSGSYKWIGGVYVPQHNRIYCIPFTHDKVLQIDLDSCT